MEPTSARPSILILEGEIREPGRLSRTLGRAGYEVMEAGEPLQCLEMLEADGFDVLLFDLHRRGLEPAEFVQSVRTVRPGQVVVLMASSGAEEAAAAALRSGAFHYVTRPLVREELLLTMQRASERARLLRDNRLLRLESLDRGSVDNIVGVHGSMDEVRRLIRKVAPTATTVMIYGESGTGKELVARAIHQQSPRASRPLFAVNCASIPETLLESELFGYEKGAFTGAATRKKGLLELASGSDLFFDEVGDLAPALQGKLLRALQERVVQRLGGVEPIRVDLRIISASHRDLAGMVADGDFRQDLFYRLNTFPIVIPPLRDRATDIPLLVDHFLNAYSEREGRAVPRISNAALRRLCAYPWPGNVRQLASAIERALILAEDDTIEETDLPQEVLAWEPPPAAGDRLRLPDDGVDLGELERRLLIEAMERSGWVIAKAAPLVGLTYRTMQYRLAKHDISRPTS